MLQIRRAIDDISKKIILFLTEMVFCDPSLELSQQESSNEVMILGRKIIP